MILTYIHFTQKRHSAGQRYRFPYPYPRAHVRGGSDGLDGRISCVYGDELDNEFEAKVKEDDREKDGGFEAAADNKKARPLTVFATGDDEPISFA